MIELLADKMHAWSLVGPGAMRCYLMADGVWMWQESHILYYVFSSPHAIDLVFSLLLALFCVPAFGAALYAHITGEHGIVLYVYAVKNVTMAVFSGALVIYLLQMHLANDYFNYVTAMFVWLLAVPFFVFGAAQAVVMARPGEIIAVECAGHTRFA